MKRYHFHLGLCDSRSPWFRTHFYSSSLSSVSRNTIILDLNLIFVTAPLIAGMRLQKSCSTRKLTSSPLLKSLSPNFFCRRLTLCHSPSLSSSITLFQFSIQFTPEEGHFFPMKQFLRLPSTLWATRKYGPWGHLLQLGFPHFIILVCFVPSSPHLGHFTCFE